MKIIGTRKRIDNDFKYKIGDYVYLREDRCRIIGYCIDSMFGFYYCIEVPSGGHTGFGSINEYGEPIDLSKFKCWFATEKSCKK